MASTADSSVAVTPTATAEAESGALATPTSSNSNGNRSAGRRRSRRQQRSVGGEHAANGGTDDASANAGPSSSATPTTAPPTLTNGGTEHQSGGRQQGRKRKHTRRAGNNKRRNHNNRRPYHELSVDERANIDRIASERAEAKRADLFASGIALAPYNTSQFLMSDRDARDTQAYEATGGGRRRRTQSDSVDGQEESVGGSVMNGDDDYTSDSIDHEFDMEMETSRREILGELGKDELIDTCIAAERACERESTRYARLCDVVARKERDNAALRALLTGDGAPHADNTVDDMNM